MANKTNWEVSYIDEDGAYNGDVIGDVTGNITGNVLAGDVQNATVVKSQGYSHTSTTHVVDAAITNTDAFIRLDATSASTVMTIAEPKGGYSMVISCVDASNTVTVTLTSGTFNGTNNVATFDAAAETLVLFAISNTRYVIVENIGGVTFS